MNTELYFPREGKSYPLTTEKAFERTVKKLSDIDVTILFKTEVNLTKESIAQALRETTNGSEQIDLVVIADAVNTTEKDVAQALAADFGIDGKLRPLEVTIQPDTDNKDENEADDNDNVTAKGSLKIDTASEPEPKPVKEEPKEQEEQKTFTVFTTEYKNTLVMLLPVSEFSGIDYSEMLYAAASSVVQPKQKDAFWKRFIPCSGDGPFDVVRKVILLLAICTFIVSSCMLVNILVVEPAKNDSTNNSIKDMLVSVDEQASDVEKKKPVDGSEGTLVDFSNLIAENEDTVGWVTVPNTMIDYVVVQPPESDPEYYLYRDFYGNSSKYGTVFLDYRSKLDSKNMILHGHHMQDGRMFANLKYFEDLSFYKKAPELTYNTIYERGKWKIISIFKTNTLEYQGDFFNYLRGDFQNDYDFLNFVYQLRERSIIDCPVTVNENDTLVSLSTCAYDFESFRFVVVARKVRDGEEDGVDVSKAKLNPDTLYPDIWYSYYGGTKPNVTSFQEAFNNKEIDWYDGARRDWSDKDDKELNKTLEEGKSKALKELKKFIKGRNYSEENSTAVWEIYDQYKALIKKAKSGSEVNEIYRNALVSIRAIQTISEAENSTQESNRLVSEAEVTAKKASSKVELHNSIAGNSYRSEQMDQVEKLFDEYNKKIDKAESVEEIESIKKEGIAKLAKIKTSDEIKAEEASKKAQESSRKAEEASRKAEEASRKQKEKEEASRAAKELKAAKKAAINEINNYVNLNDYAMAQQSTIRSLISTYTAKIRDASSISEVGEYKNSCEKQLSKVRKESELPKPESSTVISEEPVESSELPSEEPVESSEVTSEEPSENPGEPEDEPESPQGEEGE